MASLVLGIVGYTVGGPIGGMIGSTIGGLIDRQIFANAGPNASFEGPRVNDLTITDSTYGTPIPLIYGPQVRLSGNVIWTTGLLETVHVKTEELSGGKGGGSASVTSTTYTYRVSLAVALGEGTGFGLKRIWANGKLIFDRDAGSGLAAPTSLVGMVALQSNNTHSVFTTLRYYQGNGTQEPDPTIESYEGVDNTPAYRHTQYVVLTDLQLADFGNVMPSLEFEVEGHESITYADAVDDICERAGVAATSLYAIPEAMKGYIVAKAGAAAAALAPLAMADDFDIAEQAGEIRCVKRGRTMKGTISLADMGAVDANNEPSEPIRFTRASELTLPREAAVAFRDSDLDYQVNSQSARRLLGSAENNLSFEMPMTLSADEGRKLADRLLWEAWSARTTAKSAVSALWDHLYAGDIIGVPAAEEIIPLKLARRTRGINGVTELEWRLEDPEIYSSEAPGIAGALPSNELELVGETRLVLVDTVIGRNSDDDEGFFWAAAGANTGWRGATILRSTDAGTSYQEMAGVSVPATIGDVLTALPSGPTGYRDRANSVTVVLLRADDELESVSDLALMNGANLFWLGPPDGQGGEVAQFQTAELIAPRTYRLSNFLRGRKGTPTDGHGNSGSEVFVLIDGAIGRSNFGPADWNRGRLYKPVSRLLLEADTAAQSFTNAGEGKRSLSPIHVRGSRDGSNNLTVTAIRRTRLQVPGLGNGPVPVGEFEELYEWDIYNGASVARTVETTTPTLTYTAAEQTTDGLTPGDPVTVKVHQMSAVRGRGNPKEATV